MSGIKEIKFVALDVDGTLVGKDLVISPKAKAAIAAARDRGVQFVIATGRMYPAAVPYAQELGLNGVPLIVYNGAMVRDFPSGKVRYHQPLPLETARRVAKLCEARGWHLQAYVDDQLIVAEDNQWTRRYVAIAQVPAHPVGPVSKWLTEPPTKILIAAEPEQIPEIQRELQAALGSTVTLTSSYPIFLEVVNPTVSKGVALEAVAESLGFSREETMAIGDGMNDIPMLTWAGTSFAMGHGAEPVRRAATYVTKSGPSDGVAEALKRMRLVE